VGQVPRRRLYAWAGAFLAFVVVGVVLAMRGSNAAAVVPTPASNVLFGLRGSGAELQYPGGADTACTEVIRSRTSGEWRCVSWSVNIHHAVIVRPRPYEGDCAHAIVDQTHGVWTCLGRNPVPDEELPPDGLPAVPPPKA
jgi:hypothetical protein